MHKIGTTDGSKLRFMTLGILSSVCPALDLLGSCSRIAAFVAQHDPFTQVIFPVQVEKAGFKRGLSCWGDLAGIRFGKPQPAGRIEGVPVAAAMVRLDDELGSESCGPGREDLVRRWLAHGDQPGHSVAVRRQLYILLASALLAATVMLSLNRSEPSYEGRCLSDWVIAMNDGKDMDRARVVVHHLGTNAIPLLLNWLQRPDRPTLRGRYWQAKQDGFSWLEAHRWITPRPRLWKMDWRASYRSLAQGTFFELGPDGKDAIPTLIQWLGRKARTTNEIDEVAGTAYLILGHMAPASIPPLINALSSSDDQVYALAAGALSNIGPDAKAAIPVLRRRLNHKNPLMRVGAADVIGKIGGDPEEFMPVVVQALREPDLENLDYVLDILLRYKEHAKDAVPALLELLHGIPEPGNLTQRIARDQLKGTLGQLAPDAVAEDRVQ